MDLSHEIIAVGEMFKQGSQRKSWQLRNFQLSGIFLTYFDERGVKKGEFDITGCTLRKVSAEELQTPQAKFGFTLECKEPNKAFICTAKNESNRKVWMKLLEKQIKDFEDPVRRFVFSNEIILAKGYLTEKKKIGFESTWLVVLTHFPRLLLIDPPSMVVKTQVSWSPTSPPAFENVHETKFYVSSGGRKFSFRDPKNKTIYWENAFKSLATMPKYVPFVQNTTAITVEGIMDDDEEVEAESFSIAQPSKPTMQSAVSRASEAFDDAPLTEEEEEEQEAEEFDFKTACYEYLDEISKNIKELFRFLEEILQDAAEMLPTDDQANQRNAYQALKDSAAVVEGNLKALTNHNIETENNDMQMLIVVYSETYQIIDQLLNDESLLKEANAYVETGLLGVENLVTLDNGTEVKRNTTVLELIILSVHGSLTALGDQLMHDLRVDGEEDEEAAASEAQSHTPFEAPAPAPAPAETGGDEDAVQSSENPNIPPTPPKSKRRSSAMSAQMAAEVAEVQAAAAAEAEAEAAAAAPVQAAETKAVVEEVAASIDTLDLGDFDAYDATKRPEGWAEARDKRIEILEALDREKEVDEAFILKMRKVREEEEESKMVKEAKVLLRIQMFNQRKTAPLVPKGFHSNLARLKAETGRASQRKIYT